MFGSKDKIKIDPELLPLIRQVAEARGYTSHEEFVNHVLAQAVQDLAAESSDSDITEKLKGLGYIS